MRGSGAAPRLRSDRRRGTGGRRWSRRFLFVGCSVLVLAVLVGAGLYFLTPSVGDAAVRVRALGREHGVVRVDARVPRRFAEALVASEDSRFYAEPGVDPVGIVRAAWLGLTLSGVDGGGSTLSQQLAKMLYTDGRSSPGRDVEQVALAVKLNLHYSKSQILQMYAASVYFGHGFYGLHNASCGYFGTSPEQMSLAQATLLAGLVQAPSAYDPLAHPGPARVRQRYVVQRLAATGKISSAFARRTLHVPLGLRTATHAAGCTSGT